MLAEAERTCVRLQRAASRLEGSLAELDHWSTDALDCYEHLKETEHKGHSAVKPTGKVSQQKLRTDFISQFCPGLGLFKFALQPK